MRIRSKLLASAAGFALAGFTFAGTAGAQAIESWGPSHTTYYNTPSTTADYSAATGTSPRYQPPATAWRPGTISQSGHALGAYEARTTQSYGDTDRTYLYAPRSAHYNPPYWSWQPGTIDQSGHALGSYNARQSLGAPRPYGGEGAMSTDRYATGVNQPGMIDMSGHGLGYYDTNAGSGNYDYTRTPSSYAR